MILLCIISYQCLEAQCTDGTQPECACETAPVLCTVDELDGYMFSMAAFTHPEDGPSPICPGAPSSQTNNPTWFAFTAWCSDLTLRVRPRNCTWVQFVVGVQIVIFEDCTFQTAVACDIDVQDCNGGTKTLAMTGLTIGKVYYFMIDGCLGSYCDVTIDVVGVCGEEIIAPWTMPVMGATHPCVGDTETYSVETLDGAGIYHWFLDGVLIGQTPNNILSWMWDTPGTYELCIDASNDPCVPITDAPLPLCVTIEVQETNAGVLNLPSSTLCRSEIASISSIGYSSGVDNTQVILITDASGIIVQVIQAAAGTFTSWSGGIFTVYAYNFITESGSIPLVGSNINAINCGQACCDLVSGTITFQDLQATVSNIVCHNNGTDDDPSDDTFTFDLLVTGPTPGEAWRSSDGTLNGTFGVLLNCGPYFIADGSQYFDLHDYDIPTCSTSISVEPPAVCSVCFQVIDAGPGSTIDCINTSATLTGATSAAGVFQWTGPGAFESNTLTTMTTDSGWYYLTGSFAAQCTFIDSVYIDMDRDTPVAEAGADQFIDCLDAEVFIDGSASTGTNLQYQWTNTLGTVLSAQPGFMVTVPDLYTLQVTNSINGCYSTDEVEVSIKPDMPELIVADVIPENCIDENNGVINVTGIVGGTPPFSYSLNGLMTNATGLFSDLAPGTYTLQLTDGDGCILDTFFTIQQGIDLQLELVPFIELITGHTVSIEAFVNVPEQDLSIIQWSPPGILGCDTCLRSTIAALQDQLLSLTVIHENGCIATAELNVHVVPEMEIYIPNIFSPNGDGVNDYFTLYANERVNRIVELNVYDRWGGHIFQGKQIYPNDEASGWDGKFNGKEMLSSVYTYMLEVLMADGSTQHFSGSVSLVR
ncbi:MAG TPA: gliding motility-associated C-terminal domain-containing protein [Saprospiraceae bacterium]|nr:gliding motility-associated C-terminal domain-containing protein [Saprospiraceae bacterium]